MALEEALENLKRATRRYAKRQLTWFRRNERVHWLCWEDYDTPGALYGEACRLVQESDWGPDKMTQEEKKTAGKALRAQYSQAE